MKGIPKFIRFIFVGIFAFALVILGLIWLGDIVNVNRATKAKEATSVATEVSEPKPEYVYTQQSRDEDQSYVLKPGARPVKIDTNGQRFSWKHWKIGRESTKSVLLIRFTLSDGEITAWENVADQWFKGQQLPKAYEIKSIEFGVPKEGLTQKLKVYI